MTKFSVPDMSCGHCKAAIEEAVTAADPGATLDFDMDARTVSVSTTISSNDMLSLLDEEGYPSTVEG
jgi:copper chaperone